MTTHEERDLLLDLAYGELSEREARRVREHVAGCAECRAELDELQGTRRLMSALPELPAPGRGERILLAAAREQAERARLGRWALPRWLVPAVALAATVTVVTVVSLKVGEEAVQPARQVDLRYAKGPEPAAPAAEAPPDGAAAPAAAEAKRGSGERFAQAPPPPAVRSAPVAPVAPRERERVASAPAPRREANGKAEAAPEPEYDWGDEGGETAVGGAAGAPALAEAPAAAPRAPSATSEGRAAKAVRAPPAAQAEEQALAAREAVADAAGPAPLVRTFPGCPGELRREIGRDAGGRVVRYAREGMADGRRVRVELAFGPDGAVASALGRDVETGAAVPAGVLPGLPRSAAQVDPDAPPRCAR